MEFFWLGVVLLLSVIEMATADLITIWFIASGIVTLIISFFDIPFAVGSICTYAFPISAMFAPVPSLECFCIIKCLQFVLGFLIQPHQLLKKGFGFVPALPTVFSGLPDKCVYSINYECQQHFC